MRRRSTGGMSGNNVLTRGIWYEALVRWLGPARRVTAMTKVTVPHRRDASNVPLGARRTHQSSPPWWLYAITPLVVRDPALLAPQALGDHLLGGQGLTRRRR